MEYIVGFVLALFKIALQATAYATILLWIVSLISRKVLIIRNLIVNIDGWEFWQCGFVVVYVGLFLFSLTYWGDHGLGDSVRLPLGYGEEIVELNGTETLFEGKAPFMVSDMGGAQSVNRFQVTDETLCGQAERTSYFTYNMATKTSRVFADAQAYSAYAASHGLPPSEDFQPFWKHYQRYWGGWRFWLLA